MNAKKELLATSLLAIALAVGLGALSFGLFSSEGPPNVRIDVFAKKNGATSVSFLPLDQVLLEAQVSNNNASIAGAPVTFEVKSPNGTDFLVNTTTTDSLGTTNVTFQIPWPLIISSETTWQLGTWQTQATTQIYGQTLNATTDFDCETIVPTIDAFTDKGGQGSNAQGGTFLTSETWNVYVEIRNELNQTVPMWPVDFQVLFWNGGNLTTYVRTTNASGIATIPNPIKADTAAKYEDIATTNYNGIVIFDVITITVQLTG